MDAMAIDFTKLLGAPAAPPPRVPGLTIGVTGHRPDKLWSWQTPAGNHDGYKWDNPLRVHLRREIQLATEHLIEKAPRHRYEPDYRDAYLRRVEWQGEWAGGEPGAERWRSIDVLTVHGGALGADQDAAGVWLRMGLPYVMLIPFPGQESRWPEPSQRVYRQVQAKAAGLLYISKERPRNHGEAAQMLMGRNDNGICVMADELLSAWDGSKGGTAACTKTWIRMHHGAALTRLDPREWRAAHPEWQEAARTG